MPVAGQAWEEKKSGGVRIETAKAAGAMDEGSSSIPHLRPVQHKVVDVVELQVLQRGNKVLAHVFGAAASGRGRLFVSGGMRALGKRAGSHAAARTGGSSSTAWTG